jgi:hypothetical protein
MTIAVDKPPTPINSLLFADDVAIFGTQLASLLVFKTSILLGFNLAAVLPRWSAFTYVYKLI